MAHLEASGSIFIPKKTWLDLPQKILVSLLRPFSLVHQRGQDGMSFPFRDLFLFPHEQRSFRRFFGCPWRSRPTTDPQNSCLFGQCGIVDPDIYWEQPIYRVSYYVQPFGVIFVKDPKFSETNTIFFVKIPVDSTWFWANFTQWNSNQQKPIDPLGWLLVGVIDIHSGKVELAS